MIDSVLASEAWQEFNRWQWDVQPAPLEFAFGDKNSPQLSIVTYRDPRGRYVLPPMNPFWPIYYRGTPTRKPFRQQHQWFESVEPLVNDMLIRGTRGRIAFPGELTDPRPWIWAGFHVVPLFTYYLDFPADQEQLHSSTNRNARKAERAGFRCGRTSDGEAVLSCLSATAGRWGFDHQLTAAALKTGSKLLGDDAFRMYACFTADAKIASAELVLHGEGERAYGLIVGTKKEYLSGGAAQLLTQFILRDLETCRATGFDFCGGTIESVALVKAGWGAKLVTQYAVEGFDYRPARQILGNLVRHVRKRRAARKKARLPYRPSAENTTDDAPEGAMQEAISLNNVS